MFNKLFILSLLSGSALAHLMMSSPASIKSKINQFNAGDIDYSYTAPLGDGTPYPCKGYLNSSPGQLSSVATWSAGSSQTVTIDGTAIHGGGSCQLSMSYDHGSTWNVIYSYIGGCMADTQSLSFTLPKEAPSGEALFAWGWFNRLGNREMYHNCATVTITNGGSGLSAPDFPAPFLANAGSGSSCSTTEGIDIAFPEPGKNVHYGGSYASAKPSSGAGIVGTGCSGNAGSPGSGAGYIAPAPSSSTGAASTASPSSLTTSYEAADPTASVTPPSNGGASGSGKGSGSGKCTRRRKRTVISPRAHQEIIAAKRETERALAEVMKRECNKLFESGKEVTTAQEQECLGYGVISEKYMNSVRTHIQGRGRVAALRAEYPSYHH